MAGQNFILAYYQAIVDGSVCVGRWVRLVYERIVRGLEEKRWYYDAKKAGAAVDWIEAHCFHTEGPLAPGPLKLELWQKAFVACVFGIVDENGCRQFREIFLLVSRKCGKTKLAAAISSYVWRVEGGYGARVFCVAPKLEQADLVYNDIWQMTTLCPEWQAMKELQGERDEHNKKLHDDSEMERHRQNELAKPATNSTVKKIAFSAKKSDGFNPSLCVCDEVAAWEGDRGLKQYEVMKSAQGARPEGLLLSCTTAGYVNDSIFDELMKRATRLLLGDSREQRFLPVLYMLDDANSWNDINELRKSIPNLGVSVSVDYILEEIAVAEGSVSKRREVLCKYGCIKQNSSMAWLDTGVVEKASGPHIRLEDFAGCYCVAGIDLSQTRDLTSACVVIEHGGELYVVSHFWLPAERLDEASQRDGIPYSILVERGMLSLSGENFVDYHDVQEWFRELVRLRIYPLQVGYDRFSASYLVQDMEADGFHMDDVYQGENLYPIIQQCQGLLEDGKLHFGDNDLLKAHFLDAAVKMSTERGRGKLVKVRPAAHIDGAAAVLDALTVRSKWWGEIGERLKNAK